MGIFDYFDVFLRRGMPLTLRRLLLCSTTPPFGHPFCCVLLPRPSGIPSTVFYYPALRAPLLPKKGNYTCPLIPDP